MHIQAHLKRGAGEWHLLIVASPGLMRSIMQVLDRSEGEWDKAAQAADMDHPTADRAAVLLADALTPHVATLKAASDVEV